MKNDAEISRPFNVRLDVGFLEMALTIHFCAVGRSIELNSRCGN
jgi:hypothetical protein